MKRRRFLQKMTLGAAGMSSAVTMATSSGSLRVGRPGCGNANLPPGNHMPPPRPNPIAVATYSFWRFKKDLRLSMEECIDQAAAMGFDGLDLLHRQMHKEDDAYLQSLKRRALVNGLDLCGLSIHQGFVSPDAEVRDKNVMHTIYCLELCYKLGIPCLRLNTGRWGTTRSFTQLMKDRGIELPLPGHTDEDAYSWVID